MKMINSYRGTKVTWVSAGCHLGNEKQKDGPSPTEEQVADTLKKGMTSQVLEKHKKKIGIGITERVGGVRWRG